MKKLLFTVLCTFMVVGSYGQEFNRWTIEPFVGLTKIVDLTSVKPFHAGIGARYMLNTKFGASLSASRIETDEIAYNSAQLMGVINIGRIMEMEELFNNRWTILTSVGGEYTDSNTDYSKVLLHRQSNFHLTGSIDNEFRIKDNFFLSLGMNVVTGVNDRPFPAYQYTETTSVVNFRVKASIVLGNKKEHADWHLKEAQLDTIIYNNTDTIIEKEKPIYITGDYNRDPRTEYVYFNHDSAEIRDEAYDNIERMAMDVIKGVTIITYCSNTGSIEYNLALAQRRALAIRNVLMALGVPKDMIELDPKGIDFKRSGEIPELVRRAEVIIE